ncbi:hypothetical protein ACPPVU_21985 [Mucilaginibacter sp. McL0603]|uniref:hypothetical protein n=1 Tax=Mucilaginibacter sp. McL0603 TaxID=3415670 RepID=UPI003CF9D75F
MKKFKLAVIIIIMTLGFIKNSPAQTQSSGLYLTYSDFVNHKLSYGSDGSQKNKIVLHDFFEGSNVTLISNGKKQTFAKSEIFGYRENNRDYRFQNNKSYEIVDTEGFYLYKNDKLVQGSKGLKPVSTAYFSTKANAEILQLTQQNIDKAFASNYKFRNMVQEEFKTDNDLNQYDNALNKYQIKELFIESSK